MWQIAALGSLIAVAGEEVADKAAMVYNRTVDSYVATFWRQFLFLFFACVVGYLGFAGELKLFFGWQIPFYTLITLPSCYFYTHLLRKIEVTSIEAFSCLAPILYLGIDVLFLGTHLSLTQEVAILILTAGGFAFALDGRTHKVKREFSFLVLSLLAYSLFHDAVEFYTFKYVHAHYGVNGVSFFVSTYILVTLGALGIAISAGKGRHIMRNASLRYARVAGVGKGLDAAGGLLELYALSLAAVSQVSAVMALRPLAVFLIAAVTQRGMRIRLRERLNIGNSHWKAGAVGLLVLGTFLVG